MEGQACQTLDLKSIHVRLTVVWRRAFLNFLTGLNEDLFVAFKRSTRHSNFYCFKFLSEKGHKKQDLSA